MAGAENEFTNVSSLVPEALGEPGRRTFRVRAESGSSAAAIWLEKEQLFQLAMAMQRIVASMPDDDSASGSPPTDREASPLTMLDFRASKLALGYDGNRAMFIIDAHDQDEDTASVRVWASAEQVAEFTKEALHVCASGRPLCPLCGSPINPDGHLCPRANGHAKAIDLRG